MTFANTFSDPRARPGAQFSKWVFAGCLTGLLRLAKFAGRIAERRRKQRMMAELASLDDRLLKDIGIARGEIWHRFHHGREKPAWRQ